MVSALGPLPAQGTLEALGLVYESRVLGLKLKQVGIALLLHSGVDGGDGSQLGLEQFDFGLKGRLVRK